MKEYYTTSSKCRREILMSVFVYNLSSITKPSPLHLCCDVCARCCACSECKCEPSTSDQSFVYAQTTKKTPPIATLSEHLCVQLKKKLQEYRCSLCPSKNSTESQMIVKELLLGLSDE